MMSRWEADRDIGVYPGKTALHEALCETLIGRPCNCPARVLARRVVKQHPWQRLEVPSSTAADVAMKVAIKLAEAQARIHQLEWDLAEKTKDFQTRDQQLTEARLETRRVEEKLAFTQRALDLHTQHCEKRFCNCKQDDGTSTFICYVHGKANRP